MMIHPFRFQLNAYCPVDAANYNKLVSLLSMVNIYLSYFMKKPYPLPQYLPHNSISIP